MANASSLLYPTVTPPLFLLPIKAINLWVSVGVSGDGGGGADNANNWGDDGGDGNICEKCGRKVVIEEVMVVFFSCLMLLIFLIKSLQVDYSSSFLRLMEKSDLKNFS